MINENDLRDLICENITILGDDLELLNKEKYIPNTLGTRGFIDIYAKDRNNNHVLIELKRSDQASRQAIHEVIKYAEGVKSHFGANDDEIKLIIASTEWKELLVPFSSLVYNTPFSLKGIKLQLSNEEITTEIMKPLIYNKGRFISPKYEVFWYKDESSLNQGINSINKELNKIGINNYLLSILKSSNPIISPSKERRIEVLKELAHIMGTETKNVPTDFFSYIVFLSTQIMSSTKQLAIIKKNHSEETIQEVMGYIDGMTEEEMVDVLHDYTLELKDIHSDDMEIGDPAKFSLYLNDSEISLNKLVRKGFFELNTNLTDENLITELTGNKGNSIQKLEISILTSDKQQLSSLKDKIKTLLETNVVWKNQLLQILNEIESNHDSSKIELTIYHPRMALFSIYYSIKKQTDMESYIPYYTLATKDANDNPIKIYYGCLQNNGSGISFKELLLKYYSNNIHNLIHTITWGGTDNRDNEILDDVGLSYMSFHHDLLTDKKYSLINNKWREQRINTITGYFDEFIKNHLELINEIMDEISFFDMENRFSTPNIDTHIIIEKNEVQSLDISKLHEFFEFATSTIPHIRFFQGKVDVTFNGYDSDDELYMIDEVRQFIRKVNNEINYLFFFINPNGISQILRIFFLSFCEINSQIRNSNGRIELDLNFADSPNFIENQFNGLNELTEACGLSIDDNKKITYSILDSIGIPYE
ncbi:DUF91 domain-containing protein [Providencia rettgeri]|uniref:endonuclease NucS domain-containing protein n=1 Tax=Providencia TaxID=586 RepID=UPI001373F964|nr:MULTISPECIES: endonuclease NucS domain-containing protein [Providencia]MBW3104898.1 DUF91 domain-containing protein [Providencia rettgeri]BBU95925.1 hypothetical protein BML2496_18080 [Providencia rettgeri]